MHLILIREICRLDGKHVIRRNNRVKKIQLLAIASGIATFLMVLMIFGSEKNEPVIEDVIRKPVVMAVAEIAPYTEVTKEMLRVVEIEEDAIHANAVTDMQDVIGKISTTTIFAGEPIIGNKISERNNLKSGLALNVTPGKRAITIMVSADTGLANNLRAGNWVDVLALLPSDLPEDVLHKYNTWAQTYPEAFAFLFGAKSQNDENELISYTEQEVQKSLILIQNVKVLALDTVFLEEYLNLAEPASYATVTLEVTVEQAVALNLSENYNQVRLILREQNDHEIVEVDGITTHDLLDAAETE